MGSHSWQRQDGVIKLTIRALQQCRRDTIGTKLVSKLDILELDCNNILGNGLNYLLVSTGQKIRDVLFLNSIIDNSPYISGETYIMGVGQRLQSLEITGRNPSPYLSVG